MAIPIASRIFSHTYPERTQFLREQCGGQNIINVKLLHLETPDTMSGVENVSSLLFCAEGTIRPGDTPDARFDAIYSKDFHSALLQAMGTNIGVF